MMRTKMVDGKVHFPCDFCGKFSDEVESLIKGPEVGICDECIELCGQILVEERSKKYIAFLRET